MPASGVPAQLLARRPDVAAARGRLVASDNRLHDPRAQMLPAVQLSATFTQSASSALQGYPFSLWSLGVGLLTPAFDGGRRPALAEVVAAWREQTAVVYESTATRAILEVEASMQGVAQLRDQLRQAVLQEATVQRQYDQAALRFREGYVSYLEEQLAQRASFQAQQVALQAKAPLLAGHIALVRAMGGAWQRQE